MISISEVNSELIQAKRKYRDISPFELAYNLDKLAREYPKLARWINYNPHNFTSFVTVWKDVKIDR